jgi:tRNA(Ile)-lysidine synthase
MRGPCRIEPGSRLLVAASGGADSTALLIGLERLTHEFGFDLHVAHLHHGLRGEAADQDRAFVSALCERLGLPCTSAAWNTRERMRRRGLSGQAGLRLLRRQFLRSVARRIGAAAIATGHTADDQLETILMRLTRGSGLIGLGGMRPRRGEWIRPLLSATRADLEADLRAARQPWREDATNRDPRYARSRVRHGAVTALAAAADPADPVAARARLSRHASEATRELRLAARALSAWASRVFPRVACIQEGVVTIDTGVLQTYPYALRRLILQRSWAALECGSPSLTYRHLAALGRLTRNPRGGARVDLPGGRVERRGGQLHFTRTQARSDAGGRGKRGPRVPLNGAP